MKAEIAKEEADEVKGILEVIASTGKFWYQIFNSLLKMHFSDFYLKKKKKQIIDQDY